MAAASTGPGKQVTGRPAPPRTGYDRGGTGAPVRTTLPSFPTFGYQSVPSAAVMNEVSYEATFISLPRGQGQFTSSAAQLIPNATLTPVTWSAAANTGPDIMWTAGSKVTAQTPGYYDLDAQVTYDISTAGSLEVMFRVTTGANNPGGAGNTTIFGQATSPGVSGVSVSVTTGMTSPYLYFLDYVEVLAYQTSGGGLNTASPWCYLDVCLISLGP